MTYKMPFWDHVEELRWCLLKSIIAVVFGALFVNYFSDFFLSKLIEPTINLSVPLNLQVIRVTSMFMIKIGMALMGGILIAIPVIIYQISSFLFPVFKDHNKLYILAILFFSTLFFILGTVFAYYIIIPFSLQFFTSMNSSSIIVDYNFTLDNYITYVMWLLFASGLVFQLPVLSIVGTRVGILTPPFLRHYRKYAIIFFLVIGSILTPPDPISQLLIFLPLILLYELSILISWTFRKDNE